MITLNMGLKETLSYRKGSQENIKINKQKAVEKSGPRNNYASYIHYVEQTVEAILTQKNFVFSVMLCHLTSLICPECQSHDLTVHSHYKRSFYLPWKDEMIQVELLRVRCKSCRKTHVVFLSFMVPYEQLTLPSIIDLIHTLSKEKEEHPWIMSYGKYSQVKQNHINNIMNTYDNHYKSLLNQLNLSIDQPLELLDLTASSIKLLSHQFMQPWSNEGTRRLFKGYSNILVP